MDYEFPKGYKIPNFVTFSSEDNKTMMEHINRFTTHCSELLNHGYYKLRLFSNSLMGQVFTLHTNLPPNLVHTWAKIEDKF